MMTIHAFTVACGPMSGSDMVEPLKTRRLGVYSWVTRAYHYLRDALASEIGLEHGVQVYLDGPGVVSLTLDYDPAADPTISPSMDIWHRSFATLPISDRTASAHPRVMAGVLSHVAERVATSDFAAGDPQTNGGSVSVGAIFERARSTGIAVRALRGAMASGSSYPPDAQALIATALAAGKIVILPEATIEIDGRPRLGWWLVDPLTGATADQMDDGRGQSNTEYNSGNGMNGWVRAMACGAYMGEIVFGSFTLTSKALSAGDRQVTSGAAGVLAFKALNTAYPIFKTVCVGK